MERNDRNFARTLNAEVRGRSDLRHWARRAPAPYLLGMQKIVGLALLMIALGIMVTLYATGM